ncbi:MAG: hypothetical protein J0H30_10765 [Alphaproteobacteria bacterium]|nr:hypothetical protein [Alphaproteobacteria bacterium]
MSISGKAKLAGVAGWPVAHSLSPLLLSAATTIIMLMVAAWEAMSLGSSAKAEV